MDNWNLMVTSSRLSRTSMIEDSFHEQFEQLLNKPCISLSKTVKLPLLAEGHQFETVLSIDSAYQDANVLFNITLLKTFFVDGQPRIIRIEMDSKILSSWDLMNTSRLIFGATPMFPTHERQKRPVKRHSKNCFLPRKMLFLITKSNAEPVDILKFLLPEAALSTDCQSKFSGYIPCRDNVVEVNVTVEKQDTGLTVAIMSDSLIATNDLVESLKAKILNAFSRIWCDPLISNEKDRKYFTTTQLWNQLGLHCSKIYVIMWNYCGLQLSLHIRTLYVKQSPIFCWS
uniref:Uncharacterized protein n=1 Tax=Ditylenchus dipsaci TaxID=166011 RepID=A0A915DLB0_9BILA